jgi:hypothetical protein
MNWRQRRRSTGCWLRSSSWSAYCSALQSLLRSFSCLQGAPEDTCLRFAVAQHVVEVFFWTSLVIVPLLFWAQRHRETVFRWANTDAGLNDSASAAAIVLDLMLIGPQLLWGLFDDLLRSDRADEELRVLAAGIVVGLLDAGEFMPVRQLLAGDRTARDVGRALNYLKHRGWICVSSRRDRVWLSTSIRKQLADLQ